METTIENVLNYNDNVYSLQKKLFYTTVSIRMYGKRIPTVKMPFIVKTEQCLIREQSLSDCKSGTINNKTTAITKPSVPTEINGSVNPP